MASFNQCSFIGRVGKKAEIRQMGNGKQVASFSLAVDQSYKKDGQKVEKTEWVNIVIFAEGLVKLVENYTDKGSLLYISGALQTRKYVDKNGVDKRTTEIVLQGFNSTLQLLDSKGTGDKSSPVENPTSKESLTVGNEEIEDEIPFS